MHRDNWVGFILLGAFLLGGCVSTPERLPAYLGVDKDPRTTISPLEIPAKGLKAGLVVIYDTTDPDSAPALSEPILSDLTHRLKDRLAENFTIMGEPVVHSGTLAPNGNPEQFVQLAKGQNSPFLLLAIFSSSEVETPTQLPIGGSLQGGGGRGGVLGFQAENYALAELALLDGKTGAILIRAKGQAWSILERLNVPVESNVYPVVRRSLLPMPIYPTEETAFDTLRGVAANDAMEQALMHFKEAWTHAVPT